MQVADVVKFVINKVKIVLMKRLDRKLCALFAAVLLLLPAVSCKKESNEVQSILFTNITSNKLTLTEGGDFRVKYVVEPYHLQESAVLEWTTSKKDVASVRNGRITALQPGRTQITATCGNATAFINVEVVKLDVTSFRMPTSISGYVGAPVKVDVTDISPEDATVSNIDWEMTDESIATCEVDGDNLYVTGVKQGSTKLVGNGLDITRECTVTIKEYIPVTSVTVTLDKSSIGVGSSTSVSLSVLPSDASIKDVEWRLSPSSLATFDEKTMTITAGDTQGKVTLTATATGNEVSGSAELTITPPVATGIKVKRVNGNGAECCISPDGSFSQPKTVQLIAEITPAAAQNNKVTWKSHNTSRATVDQNGVVTATGHGGVLIEAECDGVKGYIEIGSIRKSSAMWVAYNTSPYFTNSYEITSLTRVFGGASFAIADPAGKIIDQNGRSSYVGMYPKVNGQFYQPKVTFPANVIQLSDTETTSSSCYITMSIRGAHSAAPITVDMGYGNPVTVSLTSGIKSFTLKYVVPQHVNNGETIKIKRPTYYADEYTIFANMGQYDPTESSLTRIVDCINSDITNLVDGCTLTISPTTPKGTYVISVDPNQYKDPASFTLIVQ